MKSFTFFKEDGIFYFGDSCARKSFILATLFRELLALGSGFRVGGRSIRQFES
jgi:hypothetical protein